MNKFWDINVRPPRGGWIYPKGDRIFEGHSETDIVEQLEREYRNNGTFVSIRAIEEEIWKYFCGREPARCGETDPNAAGAVEQVAGAIVPAEKTPERQGPPIWTFLNTLAAQWQPALHPYFLATLDAISLILSCPICLNEWREILRTSPPQFLDSRYAVCRWVWEAHQQVNIKKGKLIYPYTKMIVEYGAPVS